MDGFDNQSIFIQDNPAHSERTMVTPDAEITVYSNLAFGHISGVSRNLPAFMADGVGDLDLWYLVNLMQSGTESKYVDTVAVLGATSSDQAVEWAIGQYGKYLGATYAYTAVANHKILKRLLDRPSSKVSHRPITQQDIDTLLNQVTGKPVRWDGPSLKSHDCSTADLLVDMIRNDDDGLLLDALSDQDVGQYLLAGLDDDDDQYDALIVEYGRLDTLTQRMTAAFGKVAKDNKVTVTEVKPTKPFKRNGVAQVALVFYMSDGQTVSIVFHNPDSTPAKLQSSDVLTSWKFLLNKRDISVAVQPEQGKDVKLDVLASRILALVNQNSARFKRAQAKKTENEQLLAADEARYADKLSQLDTLKQEEQQLQQQFDAAMARKVEGSEQDAVPTPTPTPTPKVNSDFDFLQSIISGKVDALRVDQDFMIELAEKYESDTEGYALVEAALNIINQAEQAAAQGV